MTNIAPVQQRYSYPQAASAVSIHIYNPEVGATSQESAQNVVTPEAQAQSAYTQSNQGQIPAQYQPTPEALQNIVNQLLQLASNSTLAGNQAEAPQGKVEQPSPNQLVSAPNPNPMPMSAIFDNETKAPSAEVEKKNNGVENSPEVVEAQADYKPVPKVDVDKIVEKLSTNNLEEQTKVIDKVAQMSQAEPEISKQLVDDKILSKLAEIASTDISKFEGPSKERIKIAEKQNKGKQLSQTEHDILNTPSPKEIAVKNKVVSMYTIALLQKLQRDEVDICNDSIKDGKEAKIPQYALGELVGFNEIVKEAAKSDTPVVKKAALQTIAYVLRPEEASIAKELFAPYLNDSDPEIQKLAKSTIASFQA